MTKARSSIINVNDTPYYHCMGRCVRRAFLCGVDDFSGKDYSHRKQWIVDKISELSAVFMINVCAYAIMSNHYHIVLKINFEQAQQLSDNQVIEQWMMLFKGNVLIGRYLKGDCKSEAELDKVAQTIKIWRERLSDISWFMRCLNEFIAHKANEEDKCTGRFWEGRFKSQALLNEQALLSCMVYVDLNPIRAGVSDSLDTSEFTSIEERIKRFSLNTDRFVANEAQTTTKQDMLNIKLADFIGSTQKEGIPYSFVDYMELSDWTGRAIRNDKTGHIHQKEPKILVKLGIEPQLWFETVAQYSEHFYSYLGSDLQLQAICSKSDKKWLSGMRSCRHLFGKGSV
jgi:putative transposase